MRLFIRRWKIKKTFLTDTNFFVYIKKVENKIDSVKIINTAVTNVATENIKLYF